MLRVLIVDDEAPARSRLRRLLQPHAEADRLRIIGEAADGIEALDFLQEHRINLVFLDIQMPELSGFDVLDRLPPDVRPVVVFTTAYDEYALRAFERAAVDYLLKPISEERLAESLVRAERLSGQDPSRLEERLGALLEQLDAEHTAPTTSSKAPEEGYLKHLTVSVRDRLIVVPADRLISAEVQDGITRLFVQPEDSEPRGEPVRHLVSHTLDALESRLDPDRFMRVHRSALVAIPYITEMVQWFSGRYKLILWGDHEVVASRTRSRELRDRLSL